MPEPTATLLALRASTNDLLRQLGDLHWSDADVAAPSLCEGWTRGHVLTHIARNADGISNTLAGALRGQIVERYPDGWDARNAAIDAGANRPFAELLSDVRDTAERLDRVLGVVAEAGDWNLVTDKGHPAAHWLTARWKEVEIHHVDLDAGYTPDRWPPLFVTMLLPEAAESLAKRTDESLRVVVTAEGSLAPDLVDRSWTTGDGDGETVSGPDWAVLAWLVGRPAAAGDALSTAPALSERN